MDASRIRARVEPPLRADAQEVLHFALRERVLDRVKRAGAGVAEARAIDHTKLRALETPTTGGGEVRHEADLRDRGVERVLRARKERRNAALLVTALDGEPEVIADEHVG